MVESSCSCSCSRFCSVCGGVLQGHAGENGLVKEIDSNIGLKLTRLGLSAVGYGMEFTGLSYVKGNYQSFYTKNWEAKARIYSFKSIMTLFQP